MSNILVFGHKSPDTDAVTSAISFAYLQNQLGKDVEPVALGEISEETQYALDFFNTEAPRIVTEADSNVEAVMLVDHNEPQQSLDNIDEFEILSVVDHHRIANFETAGPLYYRAEPVGCTNTIIFKIYKEHGIDVPKDIAGLMLSAIISDTLLFKSPTCTAEDERAAQELAEIAEVDLQAYGMKMLKAGTNVNSKSAQDILNGDAKSFEMGDKTVRIGQVNVVDVQELLQRKDELIELAETNNVAEGYDLTLLLITNILESDTVGLVVGSGIETVEAAFNEIVNDYQIKLPGVVSRKKQVVPPLTDAFEG
ncbi:manganese-dependent inorganic pyrophosphatase [Dolosigranulum pigrum]|uniref:manganese-dependent inorganic pyrophosphatase n=1 Tax=Dolosigranulum pigrum TaxID=29394 RepID=UPI000DC02D03|nr:manganese-dependent inorganic pyrophosphatase [Dolosigranulum pigrum]RAN65418.1 manganese-dependent inorganic pyrophosphatase [Dolosigranulum pigrum]